LDDNRFYRIAVGIVALFLLGIVLKAARSVLYPFILAVFASYVVEPVIVFLRRFKIPHGAVIALILLGVLVLLLSVGLLVYSSGKTLAADLPRFESRLTQLAGLLERSSGGIPLKLRVAALLEKVNLAGAASFVKAVAGTFVDLVNKLFLLFLFLVFILAGRGKGTTKLVTALGPARSAEVLWAIGNINLQIRKYLVIKTVMSLVNGLTVWIVLEIFGVEFALLFGFLAFLLNFVPNVGSLVAAVLRVGFALFQFGTLWVPLWVLVITVGLDTAMGYFVEPRLMGKGLGLSPLVVFFSLLFWGWLWGIPGVIMAVPLVAVAKIVCQNVPGLRPIALFMES
jgi:AI-2 transport protein TqsA